MQVTCVKCHEDEPELGRALCKKCISILDAPKGLPAKEPRKCGAKPPTKIAVGINY